MTEATKEILCRNLSAQFEVIWGAIREPIMPIIAKGRLSEKEGLGNSKGYTCSYPRLDIKAKTLVPWESVGKCSATPLTKYSLGLCNESSKWSARHAKLG